MSLLLPDYRIVEKLGVGANSEIYCVQHIDTGELKAAKYVKLRSEDEKKFIDQLRLEQAAAHSLEHPVLRKVYDLRYIRKRLRLRAAVLMMEFIDGMAMSNSTFRPSLNALLRYFRDAAEGLKEMHHKGYVHADLKPGNLLVTKDDKLRLIDFGQSSAMLQAKDRIQGTIDYMAPEQARRSVLDQRTDVFGLGATLYRVLTGQAISTEMNRTAGLHAPTRIGKRLSEMNKPISTDIPTCVMRMIEDCCRDEPVDRLADMRAVIARIELAQTVLERQQQRSGNGSEEAGQASSSPDTPEA